VISLLDDYSVARQFGSRVVADEGGNAHHRRVVVEVETMTADG
jgi:hypothetical protein